MPLLGFSGSNELTESSRDRIDAIYTTVNYRHWQTLFFFFPIRMYETVNSSSGEFGEKIQPEAQWVGGCFYCCWAGAYDPIYPMQLLLDSANFNSSRNPISSSVVLKHRHC